MIVESVWDDMNALKIIGIVLSVLIIEFLWVVFTNDGRDPEYDHAMLQLFIEAVPTHIELYDINTDAVIEKGLLKPGQQGGIRAFLPGGVGFGVFLAINSGGSYSPLTKVQTFGNGKKIILIRIRNTKAIFELKTSRDNRSPRGPGLKVCVIATSTKTTIDNVIRLAANGGIDADIVHKIAGKNGCFDKNI